MTLLQELATLLCRCNCEWNIPNTLRIPSIHTKNLFVLLSTLSGLLGVILVTCGIVFMNEANYQAPVVPFGWVLSIVYGIIGASITIQWSTWMISRLGAMCCGNTERRSLSFNLFWGNIMILILSALFFGVSIFQMYLHPYNLTPCQCKDLEWGPSCIPCDCGPKGVCDSGAYGTGQCICERGWGGAKCTECNFRFKPEGICDTCKRGFTGDDCEKCDVGYTGNNCDVCDIGWLPWTHNSTANPRTIDEDGRHICDDCQPYYYGPFCKACPYGNDIPGRDIYNTRPLRVDDQIMLDDRMTGKIISVESDGVYKIATLDGRHRLAAKNNIKGLLCNGRGFCQDNDWWRSQYDFPIQTCTRQEDETCSSNSDCTDSFSCRGTCVGTILPVDSVWSILNERQTQGCSTDSDCFFGPLTNYTGGQCLSKVCCEESVYGTGECQCSEEYPDAKEPACDYCPGYHWELKLNESICEGKGTCIVSTDRAGDYVDTACYCSSEPEDDGMYIGSVCQGYDADNDGVIDRCIAGYFGPDCEPCPGGGGILECSGHGKCNDGIQGTGICDCQYDIFRGGWARNAYDGSCTECAVNFWGEGCNVCPSPREVGPEVVAQYIQENAWQPANSFEGPVPYSPLAVEKDQVGKTNVPTSATPYSNTPEKPFWETHNVLACSGHGWCNWGRKGNGACQCYTAETNPVGSASYTLGGRSGKSCE